ncbi:MAG: hypothetical protein UZ19_OD1000467 [Parcubacteria bacterium OLB19]|nr:MAG: hypothetical protein UZ19_OD1000467 [Parcubacteria bacterium OLB19]
MIAAVTNPQPIIFRFSGLPEGDKESQHITSLSDKYLGVYLHYGAVTRILNRDSILIGVFYNTENNSVMMRHSTNISELGKAVSMFATSRTELDGGFGIVISIPFLHYEVLPKDQEEESESDDNDIQSIVLSRARYGFGGWLYTKILTISNFSTQDLQISDSNLVIVIAEGEGMIYLNDSPVSFSAGDVIRLKKG